jgi:hypothetical protein
MTDSEIADEIQVSDNSVDFDTLLDRALEKKVFPTLPDDSINLFDPLQVAYYKDNGVVRTAMDVITKRRLKTAANAPDALYVSLKDSIHKDRLVIPFKDSSGQIIFYQSRKMFEHDPKASYIGKCNSPKSIAGMDKIDPDLDDVFIFEGPIDSFFVKNGVAVAGITPGHYKFTDTQQKQLEELKTFRKIWVLDNQWIDSTARDKTLNLLELGECVFFWPKELGPFKDFNSVCIHYKLDQISPVYITKNTFCGKEGVLKFKMLYTS